jgi:CRISPR system Cascade subunit CasE
MTSLFLSRAQLRRDAAVGAIASILLPEDGNARLDTTHRLVWSLFADAPDRQRDFLWRDDGGTAGRRDRHIYILSARPPADSIGLFDLETKPFEPVLAAGDRLQFRLRANPVVNEHKPGAKRGKRIDPVARALAKIPQDQRAAQRSGVTLDVGRSWMAAQGERAGFRLAADANGTPRLAVDGAQWRELPRSKGTRPLSFGALDFEGELELRDPPVFLTALANGFGKSKAFGCGLMLIRRA